MVVDLLNVDESIGTWVCLNHFQTGTSLLLLLLPLGFPCSRDGLCLQQNLEPRGSCLLASGTQCPMTGKVHPPGYMSKASGSRLGRKAAFSPGQGFSNCLLLQLWTASLVDFWSSSLCEGTSLHVDYPADQWGSCLYLCDWQTTLWLSGTASAGFHSFRHILYFLF